MSGCAAGAPSFFGDEGWPGGIGSCLRALRRAGGRAAAPRRFAPAATCGDGACVPGVLIGFLLAGNLSPRGGGVDPRLAHLIELQRVDKEIQALTAQIEEIPRHIAELERELNASKTVLDEYRKRVETQDRLRKSKEMEIDVNRSKKQKYEAQLYQARTNKEYTSLLNEIDEVTRQNLPLEEEILELMEDVESLRGDLEKKEASFREELRRFEAQKKKDLKRKAEFDKQYAEKLREREAILARIEPSLAARYERIAMVRSNAVVPLVDGACSGCFMVIRPQVHSRLIAGDTIIACENCSRILYVDSGKEGGETSE